MKAVAAILVICLAVSAQAQFTSLKSILNKNANSKSIVPKEHLQFNGIIMSFLNGANLTSYISNSTDCLNDASYFATNFTSSIAEYFRSPHINNFFGIMQALGMLEPTIIACFESATEGTVQLAKYIEKFHGNPVLFYESFRANLKNNLLLIGITGAEMKQDIEAHNWDDAAFKLGNIFRLCLDFDPIKKLSGNYGKSFVENMQDFAEGFFNGTDELNTINIQQCTNSTSWYIESFFDALAQFAKGKPENIKKGWQYIAQSFGMLYPLTYNCFHGFEDFISIMAHYFDLTKPWLIVYHAGHGIEIIHMSIVESWKQAGQGNFYQAGQTLGNMFHQVFFDGSK